MSRKARSCASDDAIHRQPQVPTDKLFEYVVGPVRQGMRVRRAGCRSCRADSRKALTWSSVSIFRKASSSALVEPPTYGYVRPDLVSGADRGSRGAASISSARSIHRADHLRWRSVAWSDSGSAAISHTPRRGWLIFPAVPGLLQDARLLRGESRCNRRPDARAQRTCAGAGDD